MNHLNQERKYFSDTKNFSDIKMIEKGQQEKRKQFPYADLLKSEKKKILIIDDQQIFRLWLAETLSDHHFQISTARSAERALDCLWYEDFFPQLILVDLKLPQMSGEDFIKFIKMDKKFKAIPIIAMSGYLDSDHPDFLPKPFHEEDLVFAVKKKLQLCWQQ